MFGRKKREAELRDEIETWKRIEHACRVRAEKSAAVLDDVRDALLGQWSPNGAFLEELAARMGTSCFEPEKLLAHATRYAALKQAVRKIERQALRATICDDHNVTLLLQDLTIILELIKGVE